MSSCGVETHLLFSGHSAIDASDTSARAAPGAWSARWSASPKGRIESEPRGPSQLRRVRGVSTHRTVTIANCHGSSWFESFRYHFSLFGSFRLAISEPTPPALEWKFAHEAWRSAIADLKPPPPGALSGALGEGTPGWVWRCDAAISRYHSKTCLFVRVSPLFSRAAKTPKWRHFR